MGGMVTITHEACPECSSTEVKPFWWQRGQAWIIVCEECKHEEGRESSEWQAWDVWDAAARAATAAHGAMPEFDAGVPEEDETPAGGPVREEVPADVRPAPLRTYWRCAWSSHHPHDRESGRQVVSTAGTLGELYEDMAAKRIAHLHYEDSVSQVCPGDKPDDGVVFSYGPVRLMAVEEERAFDLAAVEASDAWTGFHVRREEHRSRLAAEGAARDAEEATRAEERDRAEYARLQEKFGTGGTA